MSKLILATLLGIASLGADIVTRTKHIPCQVIPAGGNSYYEQWTAPAGAKNIRVFRNKYLLTEGVHYEITEMGNFANRGKWNRSDRIMIQYDIDMPDVPTELLDKIN